MGFLIYYISTLVVIIVIIVLFNKTDDTDVSKLKKSGMRLMIDNGTGCHYLGAPEGGITPRLDKDGNHICDLREKVN